MRVLITGGAGFIGSHLAERLLADGCEIRIIDNESTGKIENVPRGARYVKGDVRDADAVREAFSGGVDAVLHLAAQVSNMDSYANPLGDASTNIEGTIKVLEEARALGVGRVVYASSMALYGAVDAKPVSEDAPTRPLSFYGISKLAAESYVFRTAERNDLLAPMHVTALRMFNVYGPRQSLTNPYQGVMSVFIAKAMAGQPLTLFGSGEQSRDFVYIDDVVDAWLRALDEPATFGEVINIGTGSSISINALMAAVLEACGRTRAGYEVLHRPALSGDQLHIQADIGHAQQLLGWTPRTTLKNGMQRTVAWAENAE